MLISSLLHSKILAFGLLFFSIGGEKYGQLPFLSTLGISLVYMRFPRAYWAFVIVSVFVDMLLGYRGGTSLLLVCSVVCCFAFVRFGVIGIVLSIFTAIGTLLFLHRVLGMPLVINGKLLVSGVFYLCASIVFARMQERSYKEL